MTETPNPAPSPGHTNLTAIFEPQPAIVRAMRAF